MKINITLIGPRAIGKTSIAKKLSKKYYLDYIEFDTILNKHLIKDGGMVKALRNKLATDVLNNKAPKDILQILKKNNILLELGSGAISSDYIKTNKKNLNTILKNSLLIPLLYSDDVYESAKALYERDKNRLNLDEDFPKVIKRYRNFISVIKTYSFKPIYCKNKTINEICNEIITVCGLNYSTIKCFIFDQDGTFYPENSKLTNELRNKTKKWLMIKLSLNRGEVERLYKKLQKKYPNILDGLLSLGLTIRDYHKNVFDMIDPSNYLSRDEKLSSILKKLKGDKYVVTFASKKYSKLLQQILGINNLIKKTYSLIDFSPKRSKLQVYEHIRKSNKMKRKDIMVIGNNLEVDIKPALHKGYKTILIGTPKKETRTKSIQDIHYLMSNKIN